MRILLAEDEPTVAEHVRLGHTAEGCQFGSLAAQCFREIFLKVLRRGFD